MSIIHTYTWKPEFELNITMLDRHHRRFMDLLNEVILHINENRPYENLFFVFQRLFFYIENYFTDEEMYMNEHGVGDIKQHRALHAQFINKVRELQQQYCNKSLDKNELHRLLDDWFNQHILNRDRDDMKKAI